MLYESQYLPKRLFDKCLEVRSRGESLSCDWLVLRREMLSHLLVDFLLDLRPGCQTVEVEEEGGGGGGEAVTEQGETDDCDVLQ